MSERLLKTKRQKIAPAKPTEEEAKKVVLVGTYAGTQLTDWPGFYPYPISSDDKVDAESCAKVNEIWLFKGTRMYCCFGDTSDTHESFKCGAQTGDGPLLICRYFYGSSLGKSVFKLVSKFVYH